MSSVRTLRRPLLAGIAALSLGALALALPASAQTGPRSVARRSGPPVFSHGAVVDMQRSGFEPGIQIDSKDRLYTSVPYGFSDTQSFLWSRRTTATATS